MRRLWTSAEIARIGELRAQGLTLHQVADALGRTRYAVGTILARYNLQQHTRQVWTMPQVRELRRLYAEGHTTTTIAAKMNRTRESIRSGLKRHASNRPRRLEVGPVSAVEAERIVDLHASGMSLSALARAAKRDRQTVRKILRQHAEVAN